MTYFLHFFLTIPGILATNNKKFRMICQESIIWSTFTERKFSDACVHFFSASSALPDAVGISTTTITNDEVFNVCTCLSYRNLFCTYINRWPNQQRQRLCLDTMTLSPQLITRWWSSPRMQMVRTTQMIRNPNICSRRGNKKLCEHSQQHYLYRGADFGTQVRFVDRGGNWEKSGNSHYPPL